MGRASVAAGLDLSAPWSALELAEQKITSPIKDRKLERETHAGSRRERQKDACALLGCQTDYFTLSPHTRSSTSFHQSCSYSSRRKSEGGGDEGRTRSVGVLKEE